MREFVTAAKARETKGEVGPDVTTSIDGYKVTFKAPTSTQFAMWMTGIQGDTPAAVAAMIQLFIDLLETHEMKRHFRQRLWDTDDPFSETEVAEITKALVEEWSGRPTLPPSDSAPLPSTSGAPSTAEPQQQESTRSIFGSIASSTTSTPSSPEA